MTKDKFNSNNLESKLSPGIHGGELSIFPDYSDEVNGVKFKKGDLPFVNQEQTFMQLARILSTEYPYAVLVGDQGIGKSMILEYSVDLITGKRKLSELEKNLPKAVPLFKKIISRAQTFAQRSYLLVPNLKDPMNVQSIMYEDKELCYKDTLELKAFTDEVGEFLGEIASADRESLMISVSKKNFKKYVASEVGSLYTSLYNMFNYKLSYSKFDVDVFPLVHLKLPDLIYHDLNSDFEFYFKDEDNKEIDLKLLVERAGLSSARLNINLKTIEDGLGSTFVPKILDGHYQRLIALMEYYDVDGLNEPERLEVFTEVFEQTSQKISNVISKEVKAGKVKRPQDISDTFAKVTDYYVPPKKVSKETIRYITNEIKEYKDNYINNVSPKARAWMNDFYSFFADDSRIIRDAVIRMFDDLDDVECKTSLFEHHGKKSISVSEVPKTNKTKNDDDEDDLMSKICTTHEDVKFKIKHGTRYMEIEDILQINPLEAFADLSGKLTYGKVGGSEKDELFAYYIGDDKPSKNPPHMKVFDLGQFFQHSILLFDDSFSDFITSVTEKEKGSPSMREQFLEYLQTGSMTLNHEGVSYKFESPKMILASDNNDPFVTIKDSAMKRDEIGLRARIKSIFVPDYTLNTKESREGTLKVLQQSIQKYNAKYPDNKMTITPQAKNMLLQSMLEDENIMSLFYRDFSRDIEELCSFAESNGINTISPKVLKERTLEDLTPGFFLSIDKELGHGGYFTEEESNVGRSNGLWVNHHNKSGRIPLQSYFVPGIDRISDQVAHFELIDIDAGLVDETTFKGYSLARDYLISLLYENIDSKVLLDDDTNWKLKTYFKEMWSKIAGPSASMAITVSMLSALAGEETYNNRFMTGSIDPIKGNAGKIGGTFYKGLVPYRLSEIAPEDKRTEMYFMFPISNTLDLTRDAIFDPFGLEKKVHCLSIKNFSQAYFLSTCGEEISQEQWDDSKEYGPDKLSDTFKKVEDRFKRLKE